MLNQEWIDSPTFSPIPSTLRIVSISSLRIDSSSSSGFVWELDL